MEAKDSSSGTSGPMKPKSSKERKHSDKVPMLSTRKESKHRIPSRSASSLALKYSIQPLVPSKASMQPLALMQVVQLGMPVQAVPLVLSRHQHLMQSMVCSLLLVPLVPATAILAVMLVWGLSITTGVLILKESLCQMN